LRGSLLKVISVPSPARAGDLPELVRDQRVAADERDVQAPLLRLAQDQAGLRVVPADIHDLHVRLLQARDDGGVVALTGRVGGEQHLLHPGGIQRLLRLLGQAAAIGGVVVQDRHPLPAHVLRDVAPGDLALLVVAPADAEGVPLALVGEARVRGGGADLQHALLAYTSRAGIEEPEQKWPATSWARCPASWFATDTAWRGSHASSDTWSCSCRPSTPPAPFRSVTACSAPARIWPPKAAYWPVIGPAGRDADRATLLRHGVAHANDGRRGDQAAQHRPAPHPCRHPDPVSHVCAGAGAPRLLCRA
jgi:hypothetical protein